MSRIIKTPEDRLLAAMFDNGYIIKRASDGQYLASVGPHDGLFASPWLALEFARGKLGADTDWRDISMDEATRLEFEFPRH